MIIEFCAEYNFLQRMELSDLSDFHLYLLSVNADIELLRVATYWLQYRINLINLANLMSSVFNR